jgi:two-component system, chemotaxis family, protein-glutamate methylesterase/glutaminase
MKIRAIIVVGASAGGVTALKQFVARLPEDFPGSIFIVMHLTPSWESKLGWILSRAGPLEAVHAENGEKIKVGKIYVASSDHHLVLQKGKMIVSKSRKVNRFRPSIDALFRSAAYVYGSRVVGIILSGLLYDGVGGLWTIKQQGGTTIIQTPQDAEHPQLPLNAIEYAVPDYTVDAGRMAELLSRLMLNPVK